MIQCFIFLRRVLIYDFTLTESYGEGETEKYNRKSNKQRADEK